MIRQTRRILGVAAVMGVLSPVAFAQVTTPPPAAPEPEPAYTPPPQPVARPTPATNPSTRNQNNQAGTPVPEHDPLTKVGEDGRIIRLEEILDEVALQRNPLVARSKNDAINAARVDRRTRAEMMVIENLDLFLEIEGGALNDLALAEFEKFQSVVQKIPPLVIQGSLSSQLVESGVLTRIQGQSTNQIVRIYNSEISQELEKEFPESYLDHFMKFIINESLKDARYAYDGLLAETIEHADELARGDISPNAKKGVVAAGAIAGREAAVDALRASLAELSFEEHQELLRAVRDRRENPDQPPLEILDFHTEGAIVLNEGANTSRMVRITRPDGAPAVMPYQNLEDGQEYIEHGVTKIKGQEDEADGG